MKILDRYISIIFIKNFLIASLGLTMVYLFRMFLMDLIDHQHTLKQMVIYNSFDLPQVFLQMTPPATLIGTVLTLSGLNRTNELVALYSLGFGLARIVSVVASLVLMICCLCLVMQDRVLPPVLKQKTTYYWRVLQKKTDFYFDYKQDKVWYRSKNLIYNLQNFDAKTNLIHGMAVYSFDNQFNLKQVIEANRAEFTATGWKLLDGIVTVFSEDDPFPLTQKFETKQLIIAETPKDFKEIDREVDGLRLMELRRYIGKVRNAGADTKKFETKFHSKWSLSFIPMVMCFLGVPFSVRNRREGGVAKDLSLCLVVTFFYWLFFSIGLSLGNNGALPPWLAAWLPSMIFGALAATLIARRKA